MSPPLATTTTTPTASTERANGMQRILASLRDMQTRVTIKLSSNLLNEGVINAITAGVSSSVFNLIKLWRSDAQKQDTIQDSLRITGQAIDILGGYDVSTVYGNLYDRALYDDAAYGFWLEYAQTTGETLGMALNLASWSVTQFGIQGYSNVRSELKAINEAAAPTLGIALGIAIVVLLIVILK